VVVGFRWCCLRWWSALDGCCSVRWIARAWGEQLPDNVARQVFALLRSLGNSYAGCFTLPDVLPLVGLCLGLTYSTFFAVEDIINLIVEPLDFILKTCLICPFARI
jgi:hypothetical protein